SATCCSRSTATTAPPWCWSPTTPAWPRAAIAASSWRKDAWCRRPRACRHEPAALVAAQPASGMAPAGIAHAGRVAGAGGGGAGRGRHAGEPDRARHAGQRRGVDRRGHRRIRAAGPACRLRRQGTPGRPAADAHRRLSQRGVRPRTHPTARRAGSGCALSAARHAGAARSQRPCAAAEPRAGRRRGLSGSSRAGRAGPRGGRPPATGRAHAHHRRRTAAPARRRRIARAGAARADEPGRCRAGRLARARQPRAPSAVAARLAGIAIALSAQRYARRKTAEVALLRALGTSRRRVLGLLLGTLGALAVPAATIGVLLALGLAQLAWLLASQLFGNVPTSLPLAPALAAAAMGLAVLVGFALPPLARLAEVPPVAVFRQSLSRRVRRFDALYLIPALVALGLIWDQSGSLQLAGILAGSLLGVSVLAALLAGALLWLARRIAPGAHQALRLGLAALARRPALSVIQATALSLGLCALLLLAVVAPALLQGWRQELPADTP